MTTYRWQDNPKLSNLYITEIGILKNGFGGDFALREQIDLEKTGQLIVLIGDLNYGEGNAQTIMISFPTKYPYAPPEITPISIKNLNGQTVYEQINFNKGNQYSDGHMCLIEGGQWNQNSHNIGWALRKAQKWLQRATSVDGFPKDEIVEEIPMHFPHEGQVLLPKKHDPNENLNKGILVLTQFKPNHYIVQKNILSDNIFKLNLPEESFQWYKFPEEIKFKSLLPNKNPTHVIKAIITYFGENIVLGAGKKHIAFFLPGEEMKWHFFKLSVLNTGIVNMEYLISHVIEDEIYLRTKDIFDPQILLKKRVTIIGLGAIGSEVAISLAKNGVGCFHVFDNDTFEIGNSVRHAANILYIGEAKSRVIRQMIHKVNPNIVVNDYSLDVLKDNGMLEQSLSNSDLCLILTGEDSVDYMINDIYAKRYNIPFIYAGVSIGGFSGSIQIVKKDGACLRCIGLYGLDTLPKPKNSKKLSKLPPEYGNCSGPALPGSEIDIKEVSIQVSRLSLQLLLGKEGAYSNEIFSLYKWHGPFGSEEQERFFWETENVMKHKECEFCNV